jgi:hypothetical protein
MTKHMLRALLTYLQAPQFRHSCSSQLLFCPASSSCMRLQARLNRRVAEAAARQRLTQQRQQQQREEASCLGGRLRCCRRRGSSGSRPHRVVTAALLRCVVCLWATYVACHSDFVSCVGVGHRCMSWWCCNVSATATACTANRDAELWFGMRLMNPTYAHGWGQTQLHVSCPC